MKRLLKLRLRSETGAAAVEFALILPLLVLLLFGMLEFGRVYNAQLQLTNAAREGVRVMAIQNNAAIARNTVRAAAPALNPAVSDPQIKIASSFSNPAVCGSGATVTVTLTYPLTFVTGLFGPSIILTGRSTMRCGG